MTKEEKQKAYNKWRSRRWIITIWAMAIITIFTILGIFKNTDSYLPLCSALSAIPIGFVSLETVNKWKKPKEESTEDNMK